MLVLATGPVVLAWKITKGREKLQHADVSTKSRNL